MDYDVLVIGGGTAGVSAAIAASRCGARTLLLERQGMLGGMGTSALVHSLCGLYQIRQEAKPVLANPGIPSEVAQRLDRVMGNHGPVRMGRVDVLLHDPICLARLFDQMVTEAAPNLTVRFHSELTEAHLGSRKVISITAHCRGLSELIRTKAVVDASGDAISAPLTNAAFECEESASLQSAAYVFSMHGVDSAVLNGENRLKIGHALLSGVKEGRLPKAVLGASFRGINTVGQAFVTLDLKSPDYDPLAPSCLTELEMEGRNLAHQIASYLKVVLPEFRMSSIAALPSRAGIRESRRFVGHYTLTESDILESRPFEDGVAFATWPIELREKATGPKLIYPNQPGTGCAIPLRALQSQTYGNLFTAGRCISASHRAQASIRVMGTCLATGQAAGIAAALTATDQTCNSTSVQQHLYQSVCK